MNKTQQAVKTSRRLAAWIVEERNLLGNSIWSTQGFDTQGEAIAYAAGRPAFVVMPAVEVKFWIS